ESWMMKSRSSGARESRMAARLLTVMTLRASRRLCRSAAMKGRAAIGLVGGHDLHEAYVHALRRRKHERDRLGDVLGQQALVALVEASAALLAIRHESEMRAGLDPAGSDLADPHAAAVQVEPQ